MMQTLTIRRTKGGTSTWATGASAGVITGLTPDPLKAATFERDQVDAITAEFRDRIDRGQHTGRLAILRGDEVVSEIGEALHPDLELDDGEAGDPSPYIPAEDLAAVIPPAFADHAPAIGLNFICRPIDDLRAAHIDALRDLGPEVAIAVNAASSGAAKYLAVKAQIASHDAETAPRLEALRARAAKLVEERAAVEGDLTLPGLAGRLRAINEQLSDGQDEVALIAADRAMLEGLLTKFRPAADGVVREVVREVGRRRKATLQLAIAAAVAGIAEKCKAELNEAHNLLLAMAGLDQMDMQTLVRASAIRLLGMD